MREEIKTMRSVSDIKSDIEQIEDELSQCEFGTLEYDFLTSEWIDLDCELNEVYKEADREKQLDLFNSEKFN